MESFEDLGVHSVSVRSGFGKVLKSTVKQFYKAFMGEKLSAQSMLTVTEM